MADFRKLFPVLAVVALLMGSAVAANAAAFQCTANAGVPPQLRAEGLTELVGDLVLNCDGDVPENGIKANIRIFLNTNVTSRLVVEDEDWSEALLLIDEPAPNEQVYWPASAGAWDPDDDDALPNVFQGTQTGVNTIDWLGIPIVAPGSCWNPETQEYTCEDRVYRITNVRAAANLLGTGSSLIPFQIFMHVSISGTTSVPVNNPQQVVGYIVKGMEFRVNDNNDGDAWAFKQCEDPSDVVELIVEEGFGTSFKVEGDGDQSEPGAVYNTESGLHPEQNGPYASPDSDIGRATQGTRFIFTLAGIPSSVELSVPQAVLGEVDGDSRQYLCLVSDPDDDGSGGDLSDCDSEESEDVSVSGGSAVIVYEVVADNDNDIDESSSAIEEYVIEVTVKYDEDSSLLPGITTSPVTVNGNFAPISTVTTASDEDPVPRFADVSTAQDLFSVNACRTLLLFPYVVNVGVGETAWDTGIAISNTSMDPWGTEPQAGACKIYYYGNYPATGAPAPDPVTTPVVESGEQLTWVVSTGGQVVGTSKTCTGCATPGFQGYVIAVCDFQYAHGFAFVSDQGADKVSEAYLALVIPDRSREAKAFSEDSDENEGEQLVH